MCKDLDRDVALYFRNDFRKARDAALIDAEGYQQILFALERLGFYLKGKEGSLKAYACCIKRLVKCHHPTKGDQCADYHIPFDRLYNIVRFKRNDALHQGTVARYLSSRCVELSIIIEDTMMSAVHKDQKMPKAQDYMVTNPMTASLWHPISFIRQIMLEHSFTHIPYRKCGTWYVVSDNNIARFLTLDHKKKKKQLSKSLGNLVEEAEGAKCPLKGIKVVRPTDSMECVQDFIVENKLPVVVASEGNDKELLGIITAFDLL